MTLFKHFIYLIYVILSMPIMGIIICSEGILEAAEKFMYDLTSSVKKTLRKKGGDE